MVNRINLLLKAKNISARQFAEEIGIQPSGMSHILSGRNNPSLDFVMKVVRRYPEIDINWLMFGKGEMYESQSLRSTVAKDQRPSIYSATPAVPIVDSDTPATASHSKSTTKEPSITVVPPQKEAIQTVEADLFSQPNDISINDTLPSVVAVQPNVARLDRRAMDGVVSTTDNIQQPSSDGDEREVDSHEQQKKKECQRKLIRLLAFYDDHTFVEYRPQE